LVAKGFSQQEGIKYTKTFASITKMNSALLILSLGAQFGWKINQMDVKSAFIYGEQSKEIFMEKPYGFVTYSTLVCLLQKSLYGLKQDPRAWYAKINNFFL
jgi:hypothetical protein